MKKFNKETCWYDPKIASNLLRAYDHSADFHLTHIKTFQAILKQLPPNQSIIDIGCGGAKISTLCKKHTYVGADLSFIIDGVAKIKHPELTFISMDAETTNWEFISKFDVVLLNAFIDVMEFPLDALTKVLSKASKYVWIHRQELSITKKTHLIANNSYGGQTFHSIINAMEFNKLYQSHGFELVHCLECGFSNWEANGSSILLKKM